jgi:hypothetical protein
MSLRYGMNVVFDSRKRIAGTWDKATLSFARTVYATRFKVNYLSFFNTFFNVTSTTNSFTVDATPLVLTPGIYTVQSLATTLDFLVKTINATYSVTVNNNSFLNWNLAGAGILNGGTAEFVLGTRDRGFLVGGFETLPVLTNPDEVFIRSPHLIRADSLETDQEHNDPFLFTCLVDAPSLSQNIFRPQYEQFYPILQVQGMRQFTFELTNSKGERLQGLPTEWIMSVTFF